MYEVPPANLLPLRAAFRTLHLRTSKLKVRTYIKITRQWKSTLRQGFCTASPGPTLYERAAHWKLAMIVFMFWSSYLFKILQLALKSFWILGQVCGLA